MIHVIRRCFTADQPEIQHLKRRGIFGAVGWDLKNAALKPFRVPVLENSQRSFLEFYYREPGCSCEQGEGDIFLHDRTCEPAKGLIRFT